MGTFLRHNVYMFHYYAMLYHLILLRFYAYTCICLQGMQPDDDPNDAEVRITFCYNVDTV